MSSSKYLSSEATEYLPRSAFEEVDVPKIYDELGLNYEQYILEDRGRAEAIQWAVTELSHQSAHQQGFYVVDIGCASGRPTVEAIANSLRQLEADQTSKNHNAEGASSQHTVVGVDVSEVQLAHARQRITTINPIAQFELGDMRTWSPPTQRCENGVDAVLSFYALNHLPLEDITIVIDRMVSWLKPGGLLALGIVAHVNGRVKWFGYDVAATSLPLDEILKIVEDAGCRIEKGWKEEWRSTAVESAKSKLNQFVLAVKK